MIQKDQDYQIYFSPCASSSPPPLPSKQIHLWTTHHHYFSHVPLYLLFTRRYLMHHHTGDISYLHTLINVRFLWPSWRVGEALWRVGWTANCSFVKFNLLRVLLSSCGWSRGYGCDRWWYSCRSLICQGSFIWDCMRACTCFCDSVNTSHMCDFEPILTLLLTYHGYHGNIRHGSRQAV